MAVVSYAYIAGIPVLDHVWDDWFPTSPTGWELSIDAAPAADHYVEIEEMGMEIAIEFPLPYLDTDGSGGFTMADQIEGGVCYGSEPMGFFYIPGVPDLMQAAMSQMSGMSAGWMPLAGFSEGSDPTPLTPEQVADLVITADCRIF
jgi:hypothetical protein